MFLILLLMIVLNYNKKHIRNKMNDEDCGKQKQHHDRYKTVYHILKK